MTKLPVPHERLDGTSLALVAGACAAALAAVFLALTSQMSLVALLAGASALGSIAAVARLRRRATRSLEDARLAIDRTRAMLAAAHEQSDQASTRASEVQALLSNTEDRLLSAQKMEVVGQMAGGIAHDFNNMLTVVQVEGAFARENVAADSTAAHHLDRLLVAAGRAADLSSRLLLFSRRRSRAKRPVHVDSEIRDLETLLARLAGEQHRVVLHLNAASAHVLADANQIEQLLTNLVANARDAMPGGGRTVIRTGLRFAEDGLQLRLDVQDEGRGMDEPTRARLFEPRFTTKPEGQGAGLGLATVHAIVRSLEGSIEVHSEAGVGTVFSLFLPVAVAKVEETQKPVATPPPIQERTFPDGDVRWSVLLAEDQDPVRDAVAQALERLGCLVVRVSSALDALRHLEKGADRFDLVLADVVMPVMTGVELSEIVRSRIPEVQVLLMSGHTTDEAILDRLATIDVPILHKPFTPEELIRAVYARLAERRRRSVSVSPSR